MKIELGCGNNKRDGFYGIDKQISDAVDLVLDIENKKLPFKDNSVDYVYSSHVFEHLDNIQFVLQEILRVCKNEAVIEIWMPYGKSNDGFLFGHRTFITETHFKHICFEYDRFYLGENKGYFDWYETKYNLYPDIIKSLWNYKIPIEFAIEHMFNIVLEWGVFLKVNKNVDKAMKPQIPHKRFFYGRDAEIRQGDLLYTKKAES